MPLVMSWVLDPLRKQAEVICNMSSSRHMVYAYACVGICRTKKVHIYLVVIVLVQTSQDEIISYGKIYF